MDTEITFSNIPVTPVADAALASRAITLDQTGLTVAYNLEMSEKEQIYLNTNKTFSVSILHAQVNSSATYSGHIKYSLFQAELTEMSFDVTKTLNTDLTLEFEVTEPYTYTLAYTPATLAYYLAEVPGIISLGPALKFSIGATFTAEA